MFKIGYYTSLIFRIFDRQEYNWFGKLPGDIRIEDKKITIYTDHFFNYHQHHPINYRQSSISKVVNSTLNLILSNSGIIGSNREKMLTIF